MSSIWLAPIYVPKYWIRPEHLAPAYEGFAKFYSCLFETFRVSDISAHLSVKVIMMFVLSAQALAPRA